jgi:hypothetical protein
MALIATAATLRLPKVTKAQPENIFGYSKNAALWIRIPLGQWTWIEKGLEENEI